MKISELIKNSSKPFCSLEFFPPKEKDNWPNFYNTVKELKDAISPLFVSITYGAGGSTQDNTLEIATYLQNKLELETLVHLTCVNASKKRIADFMQNLDAAGIENVLALRGDPPSAEYNWANAEFKYASDLVAFVRSEFSEFCVAVAGYPHPHPESTSFKCDREFTQQKMEAGASFVITQLMFDVREYFDFAERLHDLGITAPVIPGVLPVQSLESLRRTLSMCGANIPAKLFFEMEEANASGGAAAVKALGEEFAIKQCEELIKGGAPGVHLYTLNKADTCIKIVNELRSRGILV